MSRVWKPGNKFCNDPKHPPEIYLPIPLRHYNLYTGEDIIDEKKTEKHITATQPNNHKKYYLDE